MPTQRLSMRRIKQLLTMRFGAGASTREIARELGVAPSTVREYLSRAAAAGIVWPLAADVTDESLMARLFVNAGVRAGARHHAEPDWSALVRELKRPGVTQSGDRDRFGGGGVWAGAAGSSQPRVVLPLAESRGRDAERESADAQDTRRSTAEVGPWPASACCGLQPWPEPGGGERIPGPCPSCRRGVAVAGWVGRRAA